MRKVSYLTFGLVVAMFWIWYAGGTDGVLADTMVVLCSMHLGATMARTIAKSK